MLKSERWTCSSRWGRGLAAGALVVFFASGSAHSTAHAQPAAPSATQNEADRAYNAGTQALKQKRYADALPEFERSYQLRPRPKTLLQVGQAAEGAGQTARALEAYRTYLSLYPNALNKKQVETQIAKLEQTPSAAAPVVASAAVPTFTYAAAEAATPPPAPPPDAIAPAAASVAAVSAAPPAPITAAPVPVPVPAPEIPPAPPVAPAPIPEVDPNASLPTSELLSREWALKHELLSGSTTSLAGPRALIILGFLGAAVAGGTLVGVGVGTEGKNGTAMTIAGGATIGIGVLALTGGAIALAKRKARYRRLVRALERIEHTLSQRNLSAGITPLVPTRASDPAGVVARVSF